MLVDIRTFIAALERIGALRRVSRPVRCMHELGAIARASGRPMLFVNIQEYPGAHLLVNGLADYRCMALALGTEPRHPRLRTLARTIRDRREPIAPVLVRRDRRHAMIVRSGSRCDTGALPAPWWHPSDGGRYVGTWHVNITSDPHSGERNAGVYRMQIIDQRHTTVSVSPHSHLAAHMRAAEACGRPLEMAVAIGVPEAAVIAASAALPAGADELGFAGALMGRPLEVVPCATVNLHVPFSAEIVLEGTLQPHVRVPDGPFMDYAGIADTNPRALLFEVHRMEMRPDAVFRGASVGRPGAEDHVLFSALAAAGLADFHGARSRHYLQTLLLRHRCFRLLQLSGRLSHRLHASVRYAARDAVVSTNRHCRSAVAGSAHATGANRSSTTHHHRQGR